MCKLNRGPFETVVSEVSQFKPVIDWLIHGFAFSRFVQRRKLSITLQLIEPGLPVLALQRLRLYRAQVLVSSFCVLPA